MAMSVVKALTTFNPIGAVLPRMKANYSETEPTECWFPHEGSSTKWLGDYQSQPEPSMSPGQWKGRHDLVMMHYLELQCQGTTQHNQIDSPEVHHVFL